jgi:phosphomannomutase
LVKELKADGGMIITASHNPGQWNGLKFVRSDGIFLNEEQANKLIHIYSTLEFNEPVAKGKFEIYDKPYDGHINSVLTCIDVAEIKRRKFKVALDSCNGAGSIITKVLLKKLGCEIVELNTNPDEAFPHNPEPIPENLTDLCKRVKETKADIGFAQDADADRLAIVTEKGIAPGEEFTLAIAVDHILSRSSNKKNTVVTNLSTSLMTDDIAAKYGAKVIRTKIGEVNVAETLKDKKGLIGGEGNGGVMYPPVGFNRDSLIGIGLVLDALASKKMMISELISSMPQYMIVKDKVECSSKIEAEAYVDKVKELFRGEKFDLTEGVKILFKNAWVHIRSSNTEPIIRIIAEAKTREEALELIQKVKSA